MKIKMKSNPSLLGSNELDIEVDAGRSSPHLWTYPCMGKEDYILELQKQVVELTERVQALEDKNSGPKGRVAVNPDERDVTPCVALREIPMDAYLFLHRAFRLRAEDKKQEALEELTTFIQTKNSVQVDRLLAEILNYEKNLYSVKPTTDPDILTIMALRSSMAYRRMYPTWEILRDLMVEKYGEGNTKLSGLIHPQIHNDLKGIVTPERDHQETKAHIDMSLLKVVEDCCDILGPNARCLVLDRIQESLDQLRENP